ncbi:phage tail protein [Phascolarctobacterium succinatutens]|uniref:phage tail-collar fiber domain-containing protein n=1 Tax=Phascolarctobacterium succinatutens TaxID=626940 RepID=UPI0023F42A08|nr:phage tail protein [Phascolarctobacterium succinatutens]
MSNWGKPVLTKQGLKLQAKVDAGNAMQLTKCRLGSGTIGSGQQLEDLTELVAPVQTLPIASVTYSDDSHACIISAVTDNSAVTTGYYLREFGLYAKDPDDGEILYAVASDSEPDFIPAKGTSTVISQEIGVALTFANASNVTAAVNTSATATISYVNTYVTNAVADLKDMTGATVSRDGVHGLVPAPGRGETKNRFLQADGTWAVVPDLTGATSAKAGTGGLVPAPTAGSNTRYLRSDGTWAVITTVKGATTTVNGAGGLVPAPAAGSNIRYLCADGTWKEVDLDSAKTKLVMYS